MEEIDLKQVFKTVYKNRRILISIVAISIIIGMIYSFFIVKPEYQSTSKVLIGSSDASIKEFIKSSSLIEKCIEELGDNTINTYFIKQNAKISFDTSTKLITVSITTNDKSLSNVITRKYIEVLRTELENIYNIKSYTIIEESREASYATNIHHKKDIMTSGVIGVIIAILYIVFLIIMDKTTTGTEMIEEFTEVKVIGKFKKEQTNSKVIDYFMHDTANLNMLTRMAVTIQMQSKNKKIKSLLISGTSIGSGSTYITTNLAKAYSKLGYKVLIIDTNKNGVQDKIFNIETERGFSDLILKLEHTNIENINPEAYIVNTPIKGISIIGYGNEKINERTLISERVTHLFKKFDSGFDIILIDAPSMKNDIVPLILSVFVDSFILVAEYEKTKLEDIQKTRKNLQSVEQDVDGIILNKFEEWENYSNGGRKPKPKAKSQKVQRKKEDE